MKKLNKKLLWFLIPFGLLIGGVAAAINVTVPQSPAAGSALQGNANGTYNSTTTPLFIGTAGIGINSTTPAATLAVKGVAGTNPLTIASSTGTSLLTVTQAGSVGLSSGLNSATNLSLYFLSNTNTGLYLPTSNEISFVANGAERLNLVAQGLKLNTTGTAALPDFFYNGDTNTGVYHPTNDNLGLSTNGTNALFIDSSQRVGIGTAAPKEVLDVRGALTFVATAGTTGIAGDIIGVNRLNFAGSSPSSAPRIRTGSGYIVYSGNTSGTKFQNNAEDADLLTILNGGNVGIGTTTPGAPLHVYADGDSMRVGTGANTATRIGFAWGGSSYRGTFGYDGTGMALTGGTAKAVSLYSNAASSPSIVLSSAGLNVGIGGAITDISTLAGSNLFVNGTSGNVGIGTTTPGALLDVEGGNILLGNNQNIQFRDTAGALNSVMNVDTNNNLTLTSPSTHALQFRSSNNSDWIVSSNNHLDLKVGTSASGTNTYINFATGGTDRMRIDQNGLVGIGTTTPLDKLVITNGNASAGSIAIGNLFGSTYNSVYLNGQSGAGNYNFLSSLSDKNLYINRPTGYDVLIGENNNQNQFVIKTGGNVGVGTTTPAARLDIYGSGTTDPFRVSSSSNISIFGVDANNHVYTGSSTVISLSSCGTSPAFTTPSDDNSGTVTAGGAAAGCTITFSKAYTNAPHCVVTPQTGSVVNTFSYTVSTTTLVTTETGLGGNKFDYICHGK